MTVKFGQKIWPQVFTLFVCRRRKVLTRFGRSQRHLVGCANFGQRSIMISELLHNFQPITWWGHGVSPDRAKGVSVSRTSTTVLWLKFQNSLHQRTLMDLRLPSCLALVQLGSTIGARGEFVSKRSPWSRTLKVLWLAVFCRILKKNRGRHRRAKPEIWVRYE